MANLAVLPPVQYALICQCHDSLEPSLAGYEQSQPKWRSWCHGQIDNSDPRRYIIRASLNAGIINQNQYQKIARVHLGIGAESECAGVGPNLALSDITD